jgi:hypothetical protein
MKFATTLFAIMATFAATEASPADDDLGCEPGTYQCDGTTGWEVCDTSAVFVVSLPFKIHPIKNTRFRRNEVSNKAN